MTTSQEFLNALVSSRRAPELADVDDLFGFLIGSWDLEAVLHDADGSTQQLRGELHVSWVSEGRAIQDLFIYPRRSDRHGNIPTRGDRYAPTIRTYDQSLNAWRVNFINPDADETSARLIARRKGQRIEMEGQLSGGTPIRWSYEKVTPSSFHYRAQKLGNDGKSWQIYPELFGKPKLS